VGKKSLVDKTRQLLELDLETPDSLKRADKLVDREWIGTVNGALAGDFVLVDRAVEDLAERLVERSFPKSKLMELIERWIDGESRLGADDYVRVVSRSSAGVPVESRLQDFVASRYPELSPWWERLGETAFLREAVFSYRGTAREATGPSELDARVLSLLGEAFANFTQEQPEAAAEALDATERALSTDEREHILARTRSEDDPAALLEQAFGERAFRFVVQEAAAKLLRMLVTDRLTSRLVDALGKATMAQVPPALERRLGVVDLARAIERGVEIRKTTSSLRKLAARALDAVPAWEKLFRDHLGLAHLAVCELRETVKTLGLDERIDLRPLVEPHGKELDRIAGEFERFYLDSLPRAGERGAGRPARMEDVFGELRGKYEHKLHPSEVRIVLMDGMRWDVWHRIKKNVLPGLRATYRVVDEVLLWSAYPTTTKVQLDKAGLLPPEEVSKAAEARQDYRPSYGSRETGARLGTAKPDRLLPGFMPLVGPAGEWVERLNLVDDKVHESTLDLLALLGEIELHCRRTLAILLEEAPRGCLVFLFSDHGFREDARWKPSARHRRARYHHGGASPWEVITPMAALYRT
jgi:hypothetical protein